MAGGSRRYSSRSSPVHTSPSHSTQRRERDGGGGGGGRNPRRITEPAVQSETAAEVQRRLCHRPQRAHYGSCRCRDDRQWQADTGRPEVKERHGGAEETDRPMKDFLWGGEERGLNKASARPIPPATILLFVTAHNETPKSFL